MIEVLRIDLRWVNAVSRGDVVEGAREGADVVGPMHRVADEGLLQQDLEPRGERRVDLARSRHTGTDALAGEHLVQDGADREDARLRIAGSQRRLHLGREARSIARIAGEGRGADYELRETIGARRDAGRVHVEALTPRVTVAQVEAKGDDRSHGLAEAEALPFGAPRIEERTKSRRGGSGGRLCAATDAR